MTAQKIAFSSLAVSILCLSVATNATAKSVYRCVAQDGAVSLQSQPCPAGSETTREEKVTVESVRTAQQPVTSLRFDREGTKAMCAERHDSFSLQAACVRNAEEGYRQLNQAMYDNGWNSPIGKAVDRCMARHLNVETFVVDYAIAGGCLRNEIAGLREMQR